MAIGVWSGRPPQSIMPFELQLVTPPTSEPISINEAKIQSRRALTVTNEDLQWQIYIEAARNAVERDTARAICWQRWKLLLDRWPDVFLLKRCPVIEVEQLRYKDLSTAGAWVTVDSGDYKVSLSEPARINNAYARYWQPARFEMGSVEVTFTAGYLVSFTADDSTDTLTFLEYEPTNGDSFRLSNSGGELPSGLTAFRTYYVVGASGNTCQLSTSSGGSAVNLTTKGVGLHFLGTLPGQIRMAMLKHIATNFADREGSTVAADCERSYLQSIADCQYTVL